MDLALFDFDGTITDREMFVPFLKLVAPPPRLVLGKLALAPMLAGYRMGLVSGPRIRAAAVRVALTGMPLAAVERGGVAFADAVLPGVLRPAMLERIGWHRSRGDVVVVVSAALEVALAPWCATHGLELLGSRLEQRNGVLTGRYLGAQCAGDEKVRRVLERYDPAPYETIHAYGDTPEDFAMLALADRRHYRGRDWPVARRGQVFSVDLAGAASRG